MKIDATETRSINPLFGDNKVKLAAFSFNGDGKATLVPEAFRLTWENSLDVAREADRGGFDAIIPFSRWGSLTANPMHRSAFILESMTWAAAVAAATNHSAIFATIMMTAFHPIVAAKAMATIDHISNGRFGANLVTGWNPGDRRMFGTLGLPREGQYAYADEWLTIIKRLWTENDPVNFKSEFFDIEGAISQPKPIQRPGPVLMNAGGSPDGQAFVANHCDMALVPSQTLELMTKHAADYRKKVRDTTGREIQVWIQAYVVLRDSVAEAERYVDYYAVEHADNEMIDAQIAIFKSKLPPGQLLPNEGTTLRRNLGASAGGRALLGTPDDIADRIAEISSCGVDGILLTWVDYQNGVREFNREIMPKLVERGLRKPHTTA